MGRKPRGTKTVEFTHPTAAEKRYARQLKKVADHINGIVDFYGLNEDARDRALREYTIHLAPWARVAAAQMLQDVSKTNLRAWSSASRALGAGLRATTTTGPTAQAMTVLHAQNVEAILKMPSDAVSMIAKMKREGAADLIRKMEERSRAAMASGVRSETLAKQLLPEARESLIRQYGEQAQEKLSSQLASRSRLIARTETARANATLTQVRGVGIGATSYVWRGMLDAAERQTHVAMEGQVINYDDPPDPEGDGNHYHAGQTYNCRCTQEIILPSDEPFDRNSAGEQAYQEAARRDQDLQE